MTRSIQSRLTLALTSTAVALAAAMGAILYVVIGAEMTRNFDRGLRSKGQALVSLVSLEAGGVLDFEFNEAAMPEYRAGKKAEYFEIQFADGKPYARAKALGNGELRVADTEVAHGESVQNLTLPNGKTGRAIRIAFVPQSELPPPTPAKPMVAVIARDRAELDENLGHLLQSLIGAALILGAATAGISSWIVRHSLRPLRRVADEAAAINATTLDARLPVNGLPAELAPICERLNNLLSRLEAAFARERRFTSDVAHELRTPIAELRSIAEVAMRWPDEPRVARDALSDSLAIAVQMQTLVSTLLSLVRAGPNQNAIDLCLIRLAPFVEQTAANLRAASEIGEVELSIPESISIIAEPTLLGSVLNNLLHNAAEYSCGGKPVRCSAIAVNGQVQLNIENQTDNLSAEDLPKIFEPFWRKDVSRSINSHAGLGLALVRAYCGLMGIEVRASLDQPSTLRMTLVCPAERPIAKIDGQTKERSHDSSHQDSAIAAFKNVAGQTNSVG